MTSYVELLLLTALILFIIGRFLLPPIVLVYALRDADPRERAEIIKQLNVYYRRRGSRRLDSPSVGDTTPKQITGTKDL